MNLEKYLIKKTIDFAELIAEMFSPYVETVVHDLTKKNFPIIAIFNGQITGRKKGDFSTVFGEMEIMPNLPRKLVNYTFIAANGKKLKSSSKAIRTPDDVPICAFSINFDTSYFQQTANNILNFINYVPPVQVLAKSIKTAPINVDFIQSEIEKTKTQLGLGAKIITKKDKKEIVKSIHNTGLLNKRGSVTLLSKELGITRATIYKYVKS